MTATAAAPAPAASSDVDRVRRARRRPARRVQVVLAVLTAAALGAVLVRVLLGDYVVALADLVPILRGETLPNAPGASFIVLEAKLPRAVIGALAGLAFGASGAMFQTSLRNPLASPDIVGISLGASAAAVIALTFLDAQGIWL
ncbi:MAG: iron chelate uptake ABC transporter family permease subunit, partial [Dermatophilaceae bacterium]|nr:iron chelate uptake ABC transporter family permease subunit [Dermatophilaceae bacterium]